MAVIVVTDLANVSVDGVPSGSVTDVLANFKNVAGIRGDLLGAMQAWHQGRQKGHADDLKAQADARDAAHAAALAQRDVVWQGRLDPLQAAIDRAATDRAAERAALVAQHKAEVDKLHATVDGLQATIAGLQATIGDMQAHIDVLGGTELGKQMARDARRAALLKAKAEVEAELTAIDGKG